MKKAELLKGVKLVERLKTALEPIISDLEKNNVKVSEFTYSHLEKASDGSIHLIFIKK